MNTIKCAAKPLTPRPGSILKKSSFPNEDTFILARVGPNSYCAVSLIDGVRWSEPVHSPEAVLERGDLFVVADEAEITVTPGA